jgi:outer membrane protein assembly factor BamB
MLAAGDGAVRHELPLGTPSFDWGVIYAATNGGGRTTVRAVSTADGHDVGTTRLDGEYRLPTVGPSGLPGGLSGDGRRLVLERQPEAEVSRFVALDTASLDVIAEIALLGSFTFDVLSPDGSVLYLLQYLEADRSGRYQVRAYDIGLGTLRGEVVVDKATLQSAMEGQPVAQVLGRDGRISYTLYHNHHHGPFIHALNTGDGTAICIDLPRDGREDHAAGRYWGLALSADGRTLFAANAALGLTAAVDTAAEKVVNTSTFAEAAAPKSQVAASGLDRLPAAPMLGVVTLSTDGRTLYAAGLAGVSAIDAGSLELRRRHLPGSAVSSVAVSADGDRLYASASGSISILDATSGEPIGNLTEAEQPYGILMVTP